ncbi:MAG: PAS domain S-box protein [Candidatus Latescibacteria bacterium]|nr:PAS domain S-box protein [Candidatus Latescibacterota bacterium]
MDSAEPVTEHILDLGRSSSQLEEAFTDSYILFNETTRKYMEAYRQLEEQFEYLNIKLEETNRELRKSLEEKDRVSNYLNNILESMSGGVLVVDLDGNITLFNQAAEGITGLPQQEVQGHPYAQVIGLDAGRELSVLHTLETYQSLINQEKNLQLTNGRTIPLGFSTALVRDAEGDVLGAVEVFNDLTEVKRLEAQVQRMHTLAALGEMAATVAHEIRNPLGGIAGFATLLERDLAADDPRRRLARKITEGVARLNRIVSSLLSYTRPLTLNTRPVNMVEVVEEAAAFFEIDLERRPENIALQRHYPDLPMGCAIDPEQFQQVILNLLHNATQAMAPRGGTIAIGLSAGAAEPAQIRLTIRDQGMGMSSEVQEKLFTPFFTTKEDGTGLGLVTSKKIVEAHGGLIQVESEPGKGTCFTISIPHNS